MQSRYSCNAKSAAYYNLEVGICSIFITAIANPFPVVSFFCGFNKGNNCLYVGRAIFIHSDSRALPSGGRS